MIDHHLVHLALRNRAASALPAAREYENVAFTPPAGAPYVEEDYVPATSELRGLVKAGTVEDTAMYVLRWYGIAGQGTSAMNTGVQAILALFRPGDRFTATDGTVIRVRGDVAPTRSQIINAPDGRPVATVTIPIRVFHQNPA